MGYEDVETTSTSTPTFTEQREFQKPDLYAKLYCVVVDAYQDREGNIVLVLYKKGKLESRIKSIGKLRSFIGRETIMVLKHYKEVTSNAESY